MVTAIFTQPHTHFTFYAYTKIVTFIYWIYVIKGGDRLTTIWFNTVNICILLDDFFQVAWTELTTWSCCFVWRTKYLHKSDNSLDEWLHLKHSEWLYRICIYYACLCTFTLYPWMGQIGKLLSSVQVNDESQYDLYFDWISLNQATIFQIILRIWNLSACYLYIYKIYTFFKRNVRS